MTLGIHRATEGTNRSRPSRGFHARERMHRERPCQSSILDARFEKTDVLGHGYSFT